jgi:Tripartite ATP-independent periplasmic transporter, DctM component
MLTAGAFIMLMLVGVPIGICLCLGGAFYIWATGNPVLFQNYPLQLFGGVDSYGLIAVPLFILIGEIMNGGGLAYVNMLANMFVASILGSAGNEPKMVENFRGTPITMRTANPAEAEAVVAEFDKIWVPKAPILAELRKVGKTL